MEMVLQYVMLAVKTTTHSTVVSLI